MGSLLALCSSIYFLILAVCNITDHKWFMSRNSRILEDGMRKKFRRMESVYMFLLAAWSVACLVMMEKDIRLDLPSDTFDFIFRCVAVGGGIALVLLILFVEKIYYEWIQ